MYMKYEGKKSLLRKFASLREERAVRGGPCLSPKDSWDTFQQTPVTQNRMIDNGYDVDRIYIRCLESLPFKCGFLLLNYY